MTGSKSEIGIPPSNLQIFRGDRVSELQQSLATRVLDNGRLVGEDQDIVNEYRRVASNHEEEKERGERLRQEVNLLRSILGRLDPLKRGLEKETQGRSSRQGATSPSKNGTRKKTGELDECAACKSVKDQHLMTQCGSCEHRYHLACLSPPLAK